MSNYYANIGVVEGSEDEETCVPGSVPYRVPDRRIVVPRFSLFEELVL